MLAEPMPPGELESALSTPVTTPARAGRGHHSTWKGVPHRELVEAVSLTCLRVEAPVGILRAMTSRDGHDLTAWFGSSVKEVAGHHRVLCVVSSNAQRRGLKFFAGAAYERQGTVVVTSFRNTGWRYTDAFDVRGACREAALWWVEDAPAVVELESELLRRKLVDCDEIAPRVLIAAARARVSVGTKTISVLPWSYIKEVDLAFRRGPPWAIDLSFAFGAAAMRASADTAPERMLAFHRILAAEARR